MALRTEDLMIIAVKKVNGKLHQCHFVLYLDPEHWDRRLCSECYAQEPALALRAEHVNRPPSKGSSTFRMAADAGKKDLAAG